MSKISLERALSIAREVAKRLEPYCEKPEGIEVAGSVRRKRPWVNDIDFVLIPSDPWNLHHEVLGIGQVKLKGEKIMRVMAGLVQIDLYFASRETWATLLLIRTGSTENNIRLCSRAKDLGWHLAASGDGLFDESGQRIAGDSEISIYNTLGLPWQRPEERG